MKNFSPTIALHGIAAGLLILAVAAFVFSALFSYQQNESVSATLLLAIAIGIIAFTGLPLEALRAKWGHPIIPKTPQWREKQTAVILPSLLLSAFLTTIIIQGDIRSWFLVALVVLSAFLLSR